MRAVATLLGLALLAGLWLGPAAALAQATFTGHMARHMALVTVVPVLLALAVAGSRLDPVARRPRLFAPIPLAFVELVVVWGWHAPALHHAARHHGWALAFEQGSFLLTGLLLWLAALGGGARHGRDPGRAGAGVVALLLTSMHMTLLGALLALAPRPLYGHGSLADQQLGGAVMLMVGGACYLAGGVWLSAGLVRRRQIVEERG